jgi:hypothetical protein
MATTFYLRSEPSTIDPGAALDKLLSLNRGTGLVLSVTQTGAGPIGLASMQATDVVGGTVLQWISNPLNAVTISGTITANLWVEESDAAANATSELGIVRLNNAGAFVSTICDGEAGPEMAATTRAAQNWNPTTTSTTLSAGDRLGVIVFYNDATATTMAAGHTMSLGYSVSIGAADGDSFVTFTETITQQANGDTLAKVGAGVIG